MLRIVVHTGNDVLHRTHAGGPLEIGRGPAQNVPRLQVNEPHLSRNHVRLEESSSGLLHIENISRKNPLLLNDATRLDTGASVTLPLPVRFCIGSTQVQIEAAADVEPDYQTIRAPIDRRNAPRTALLRELGQAPSLEKLAEWFERAMLVQRAAAGSPDFFAEAARAVVDLVGLSSSCVLLRRGESWHIAARYPPQPHGDVEFSTSVLDRVLADRRTFFETFQAPHDSRSLREIEAVVASPILDDQQQLVGVLYGSRHYGTSGTGAITPLEAQFVQLLATAVSAGLMRQEHEVEAARLRVQFEQFFSPVLALELERDPELLEAREREITMLFADVRGFSGIAERIGPRETFRLVADVLDQLSATILDFGGVIIDYYGDGVAVMWNAPVDQPGHAALACRAARTLLGELPRLNQTWSERLGHDLSIGLGIHTGAALVGNAGSRRRLKYGPRGHTVNVASRLEQATKHFGVPLLVSESSAARIEDTTLLRPVCRARLYGLAEPILLHTLADGDETADQRHRHCLALLDAGQFDEAQRQLASMAATGNSLALALLSQLESLATESREMFDGTFHLSEK